ncbi:anti-sigma B factor RsbW [Paenibacillus eucommiae]|uniref:Serine/threonine-protein kinase RsbW n=1 Tax=Paenibacillus eucommiae TaxID=1355755 RepID=A0ABS4IN24_9BACL|nr:anti-sigma B factor RsbW [Paenibacillus eucommiae]MBP1988971.1 serine/threonine-protein kinase RsbW [Paenibacillus eucommiae]
MKLPNRPVSMTLPAEAEYLDLVRFTLYGIATRLGFSYEETEDMKVAVSEACNNVVIHAYEPGSSGLIAIRFEPSAEGLRIFVKDEGTSFDTGKLQASTSMHDKTLDDTQVGGLGLYLMQALMDEVEVKSNCGTEVILTKMLIKSEEMV